MPSKEDKAPEVRYLGEGENNRCTPPDNTARRQYLCERVHAAGPRPTFHALSDVASGKDLDEVLEDYARLPTSFYRITGASSFVKPILVWASTWLTRKK
jgi:hypothetical protein